MAASSIKMKLTFWDLDAPPATPPIVYHLSFAPIVLYVKAKNHLSVDLMIR